MRDISTATEHQGLVTRRGTCGRASHRRHRQTLLLLTADAPGSPAHVGRSAVWPGEAQQTATAEGVLEPSQKHA